MKTKIDIIVDWAIPLEHEEMNANEILNNIKVLFKIFKIPDVVIENNSETILYFCNHFQNRSLSLHTLVENTKWLLTHISY